MATIDVTGSYIVATGLTLVFVDEPGATWTGRRMAPRDPTLTNNGRVSVVASQPGVYLTAGENLGGVHGNSYFLNAEGATLDVALTGHMQAIGDFNHDGKADALWRNDSGRTALWEFTPGGISYHDLGVFLLQLVRQLKSGKSAGNIDAD